MNQSIPSLTSPRNPHPAAPVVVGVSHAPTPTEAAGMSDAALYDAARAAARTHDSAQVAPYLDEMKARPFFDLDKILEVASILWPPRWTDLRMKTRGTR